MLSHHLSPSEVNSMLDEEARETQEVDELLLGLGDLSDLSEAEESNVPAEEISDWDMYVSPAQNHMVIDLPLISAEMAEVEDEADVELLERKVAKLEAQLARLERKIARLEAQLAAQRRLPVS